MSGHAYQCVLAAPLIVDAMCVSVPRVPLDAGRASPDLEDHRDESLFVRRQPVGGGIQVAVCVPRAHDCACETVAHSHELAIGVDFCEGVSNGHRVTFR